MTEYNIMVSTNGETAKLGYAGYKSLAAAKRMAKSVAPWQPNRDPHLEAWVEDDEGKRVSKVYSTEAGTRP
ncbi:hypothetical protein [Solidesulfovibrio carbinolicus]|jgi:hypothetical protein|uniref:DUF2188 domain-containing protein n=1 Tax=Solidesulfovibrio carbinolicus TaxID=296842 RepID=A0A4P6HXY3_9BACT|nr:hypothetical protein [Solidesulfovibrio carbinolicus]QAZ66139.1 hypothetical protein C3Y92_02325 [Solidesulfovibrio carbinolicus]HML53215.1 hypothetical protein [Solidesulfovibrio magneticus]